MSSSAMARALELMKTLPTEAVRHAQQQTADAHDDRLVDWALLTAALESVRASLGEGFDASSGSGDGYEVEEIHDEALLASCFANLMNG